MTAATSATQQSELIGGPYKPAPSRHCEPMLQAFPLAFDYVASTADRLGDWQAKAIWSERLRSYSAAPTVSEATEDFNARLLAARHVDRPAQAYLPDLSDPIAAITVMTSGIAFVGSMPPAYAQAIENVVDHYSLIA